MNDQSDPVLTRHPLPTAPAATAPPAAPVPPASGAAVTEPAAAPAGTGQLRPNAVGAHHLVFFVVSSAAPLTGMAGFIGLAFILGGIVVPSGYLIAGITYAVFAVGFTAMSRHMRNSGAFYAYITAGFGRIAGGGAAVLAYVAYALGQVGFAAAAGVFTSLMLDAVAGLTVSWQACALVSGLVIAALSYSKVTIGARVLAVLLTLEIGILFVMAVFVLAQGGHEGLSFASFNPVNLVTPSIGVLFVITFIMFIGFEQTAIYSEEARDPRRTVPRATYWSVGVLTVTFTFISWVILMAAGPSRLESLLAGDPSSLMFNLNDEFVGEAMTAVMQILIVTSFFASVLAFHNAGSRYLFSLGREGILPAALARTGGRTKTPSVAGIVHTVLVIGLLAGFGLTSLDPYTQIIAWTNAPTLVGVIALEIATSLAVIRFLGRSGTGESRWQRLIAPALATVLLSGALGLILWQLGLLTGLGYAGNALVLSPLLVGFVAGAVRARRAGRDGGVGGLIPAQRTGTDG
ncbi:APC family permease [Polymorphospora rubra]|uniref:Amino acid permease n=1 Tax=Polymorphospora rubra TaxID=338584 RepID=A0A810N1B1_9ACTN|nr:APC family permease [Polymorphospora rubra]BCJ66660.1 amino acid permease [Polymorphospora rubra]